MDLPPDISSQIRTKLSLEEVQEEKKYMMTPIQKVKNFAMIDQNS